MKRLKICKLGLELVFRFDLNLGKDLGLFSCNYLCFSLWNMKNIKHFSISFFDIYLLCKVVPGFTIILVYVMCLSSGIKYSMMVLI